MRRRLSRPLAWKLLLLVSIIASAWATVITLSGGVEYRLFDVRLSSRDPYRAIVVAVLAAIAALSLLAYGIPRSEWKRAWLAVTHAARASVAAAFASTASMVPWLPLAASLAVAFVGLSFGARAVGGADTYGYVSQAHLWVDGELRIEQPFAAHVPWPNADWTLTPLGYRPGTERHTLVPIYSPGLPLIMAGVLRVFGDCSPYFIMPIAAGALVLLTGFIGRRVGGPATGSIAALLVATAPTLLFQMLTPMSDVIAATLWTAAIALAFGRSAVAVVCCGLVCGLAILVRPNLAMQALIPFLIVVWQSGGTTRTLMRAFGFSIAAAPGLLAVAAINSYLYGSPFESGYGTVAEIYSVANMRSNLARYPAWLLESQSGGVFLFLAALFRIRWRRRELPWRALFLLFIALLVVPYLLYIPFDAWWYLRFILPAFPLMFVLWADSLQWMTRRLADDWGRIAVVAACASMAVFGVRFTIENDLPNAASGEQRYADVGHFIARELPVESVCLAMQHSGSVRYYSHCKTLRYDILEPRWLDRAIAHLVQRGHHPYIVLDDWEEERFRERFKDHSPIGSLDWKPLAALDGGHVRIYDAAERNSQRTSNPVMRIPPLSRTRCVERVDSR